MSVPTIVTGDDANITVDLKINGATFAIDSGAIVRAAIVDTTHESLLAGPNTVLEATSGSDWANSRVVATFSTMDTAALAQGNAYIELEVDDSGKNTWFVGINIVKGHIT